MAGFTLLSQVAVKEIASAIVRENIVQSVLPIPGKGWDGTWGFDVDGISVAIQRTKGSDKGGRRVGAATNGGFVNTQKSTLASQITELPLDIVFDAPTDVPELAIRANGTGSLLRSVLNNIPKDGARTINCGYFATLISRAITANPALGASNYTAMAAATAAGAMDAFNAAFGKLQDGDTDNGFDIFPQDHTQVFARSTYLNLLRGNAGIFTGNFIGQQMMSSGSFSALDAEYTPDSISGYMGEVNGAVVTAVGSLFKLTEGWLCKEALANGAQTAIDAGSLDHLMAIYVCGLAVAGAIDVRSEVKVVDLQGGQGYQAQPLIRCGFELFSPKGVQLIADNTGLTASKFVTVADSTMTHKCAILAPGNRS